MVRINNPNKAFMISMLKNLLIPEIESLTLLLFNIQGQIKTEDSHNVNK